MRIIISFICFLPFFCFSQNYNMELLSNVRFPDNCSDIWGYADSAGREYAFVGRVTGTSVFDITNPKNPVSLQFIPGAISSWREIKTYKNRAYVVADKGQDGMIIINLSQAPSKITWTTWHPLISVNDKTLGISKVVALDRAHDLFIDENGICYLHGSNVHQGLVMLDLNKNPDVPEYIGIFNPAYSHGGFVRRDTFWSADIFAGEFSVWDIKDKNNPKKLASQRTGSAFTHSIVLSDDNKYAFITDERGNAFLESYQVDNLNNITFLDHYRSRPALVRNTIPHNIEYLNKFIINAYYTDGFTVVDASDPAHLVEVGAYDTYPAGDGDFHGCWGAYPYLPSGNIIASDIEFGLYIVKPTYIHASYLTGLIKDSLTGLTLADASIRLEKIPFNAVLSTSNGTFKTGGPYIGDIMITISKTGYETKKISVNIQQGKITDVEIKLKPFVVSQINIKVIDAVTKLPILNAQTRFEYTPGEAFLIKTLPGATNPVSLYEGNWTMYTGAWGYKYNTISQQISGNPTITIELNKGYEDNFVFNYGWTAGSTAFAGIWGRAEPLGSYILEKVINPEFDLSSDFGEQCMITGNSSTIPTADDVDGGYTRLFTPDINLSTINKPVLNFYAWTARLNIIDSIPAVGNHKVYITSGGDTLLIDSIPGNKTVWSEYHYNLDKTKLKNLNSCTIFFQAFEPAIADARNVIEFGVDGFSITDGTSTANVDQVALQDQIRINPNPVLNTLNLSLNPKSYDRQVLIVDLNGSIILKQQLAKEEKTMSIFPECIPGVYFLIVENKNGQSLCAKFLKL
jgi:choice-of-anchor B domain-containing protein